MSGGMEEGEMPWGPLTRGECASSPPDAVMVHRVGTVGGSDSGVAIAISILEEAYEIEEFAELGEFDESVVFLNPATARYIAAALINAADECEGLSYSPLMLSGGEFDGVV